MSTSFEIFAEETTRKITLRFPKNFSTGRLYLAPAEFSNEKVTFKFVCMAVGEVSVKVPVSKVLYLDFGPESFTNPEAYRTSSLSNIDRVKFTFISMNSHSGTDRLIAHLTNLCPTAVDAQNSDITDKGASELLHIPTLRYFSSVDCGLNGKKLFDEKTSKRLETLRIHGSPVSVQSANVLGALPNLKTVDLNRASLTDASVRAISQSKSIEVMYLGANPLISDGSVAAISGLKKLRRLALEETGITYRGVSKLRKLPLSYLCLSQEKFSPAQISQLAKLFPQARVVLRRREKLNHPILEIFAK